VNIKILITRRHDEGCQIHKFKKHEKPVSCIKLSHDERSFISASWDKKIFLWSLDTGSVIREFSGPSSFVTTVQIRHTPLMRSQLSQNSAPDSLRHFTFLVSSIDGLVFVYVYLFYNPRTHDSMRPSQL
jgi:WD40 repeat protein